MALQAPNLACLLIEEFSDHQNNNETTSSRLSSLRISAMDNPCFVFVSQEVKELITCSLKAFCSLLT